MKERPQSNNNPEDTITVWDVFIRLSHITYILLLPLLYWTASQGMMDIHQYLGISLLVVVILRIIWGFFGSKNGRFSSFLVSPATVFRYAFSLFERDSKPYVNHNPMGAYMVVIMLLLLLIQASLGLFGTDDIIFEGPLAFLISYELSVTLTGWHHWLFDFILAAIGLHIAAVLWYQLYKKQALIQAMIHGKKPKND